MASGYLISKSCFQLSYHLPNIIAAEILLLSDSLSAQLLDTASKVLPLVVTISGRVCSDAPISCEYSGMRGVIVEETVKSLCNGKFTLVILLRGHFLTHNIQFRRSSTSWNTMMLVPGYRILLWCYLCVKRSHGIW